MDGEEVYAILKKCKEYGVKKIIMEHPNFYIGDAYNMEDLLVFAENGVYLSLSLGALHPLYGKRDPKDTAAIIKAAGAEHCIMMTDYGQAESSAPTEGMKVFCEIMLRCGISQEEIYTMIKYNPAKLLDLD
jgi:predicted metal-dependent TIM-barrel fold hydrolase